MEVPCEIREYTEAEARDGRLIGNLQRADLTPLEEAESYEQRLAAAIEEGKPLTAAELAQQIGKNEKCVRFRLRLVDAVPPVKEALRKGKITLGHALEIIRVSPNVQSELLRFFSLTAGKTRSPTKSPVYRSCGASSKKPSYLT
jgi:ParB-like chromosome segregation protein Spo0J